MDPTAMCRILVYGGAETRRRLVAELVDADDFDCLRMLADTVRAGGPWRLRVRCLEALGLAAGEANESTAEHILGWLLAPEDEARPSRDSPEIDWPAQRNATGNDGFHTD